MQKENEVNEGLLAQAENNRATPKPKDDISGGSVKANADNPPLTDLNKSNEGSESHAEFDELIKGPYKEAFTKKVQAIINKRFKDKKTAENGINQTYSSTQSIAEANQTAAEQQGEKGNPTLDTLLNAGVDYNTAYSVLHLEEILEASAKRGAELAAKSITDGMRYKAARPSEAVLSSNGYAAKNSVSALTPERRKELAKKAMMGEKIGF